MKIPLVDLKISYKLHKSEIDKAINKVIQKTDFIMGDEVKTFEEEFARFLNVKNTVGVSSGTDAIHLALKALGVKSGDEVILPSHTFTATAEPVVWLGAKPVFVDIDEKSYTIDPSKIEKAITSKTKVIIPVHLYGQTADMDHILKIAHKNNFLVLEDAAQAHGAAYKGKKAGTIGDIGVFSFYPGKNLGSFGDAGMVVSNNSKLTDEVRMLRNHGRIGKYEHDIVGFGNRLDTIQAAILSAKLKYLSSWNEKRTRLAALYNLTLSPVSNVITPYARQDSFHVYHLYVIRCPNRDELRNYLTEKGIQTGIHYPIPLHLQKAYSNLNYKKDSLPVTESVIKNILSLPIYPEMSVNQVKHICKCIKSFYS